MRGLVAALALALTGAAPAPRPGLWKLADADTTIYLFGTFHALPAAYRWRDAELDAAFAKSDRLVIETIVGDPATMGALLIELGTPATALPPLAERVSPGRRDALAKMMARSAVPAATLDRLETWTAAFLLMQPVMSDLGIAAADGVEDVLQAEFAGRRRPVEGLETVRAQLGVVDTLAEADQRRLLEGIVDQSADIRAEFQAMLGAWARGDEAAIARTFDKELDGSASLRAALLTRRNAAWADQVGRMLERPGTILVAVGAGHLAGGDSLQTMLANRGLKVERVR